MANDWILDVLSDLKAFALKNGLHDTAEQIDDTVLVAAVEISTAEVKRVGDAEQNERAAGHVY